MESKNNNSKIDKTMRVNEPTSQSVGRAASDRANSSRASFTLISHMILFMNDEVTIII